MYNTFSHNMNQIYETEKAGKEKVEQAIKEKYILFYLGKK
jgi:hypothetical protein